MFEEFREILFTQASQIALVLNPEVATTFLGFDAEDWHEAPTKEALASIDLQRFNISSVLDKAYDFAFQVRRHWDFGLDEEFEASAFGEGVNYCSFEGAVTPYRLENSKVRHVVDMALSRLYLERDDPISIRGLSLLAGMTEAAVRNSLSKENIQTQGKPASVAAEAALKWLEGRRGFIPTLKSESLAKDRAESVAVYLRHYPFPEALKRIIALDGLSIEDVARSISMPLDEFMQLLEGDRASKDIATLIHLASALNVDQPHFVGLAIEYALRSEMPSPPE